MLDNDDPEAPNGGKPVLLRMSVNDREKLDQICKRTGLNPSDALRAAINIAHRCLTKPDSESMQWLEAVISDKGS